MKAAFVSLSMSRQAGGLFECMRRLGATLAAEQAVPVEVLALADRFSMEDLPAWPPLDVHIFPSWRLPGMGISPAMDRYLRGLETDLLHTHGLWSYASVAVRKWARRTGRPYLVSPHGMLDAWALANSGWKKKIASRAFERGHLEHAACLHALCAAEAGAIRAVGLRNPVCVIPNGVDLPDLHAAPPGPPPWAGAVPADRRVMLYLGRIHPKKGLANLLRAWAAVRAGARREAGEWTLVVAGWDQHGHEHELRRLATELGVATSVHLAGPLFGAAKANAYRQAQAFALPSFSEGLPLVVLEAWAAALPVVMTPACNLPEGFAAAAALVAAPETESLTHALAALFQLGESERAAMGKRGRALVERSFTWSNVARQMREVYAWMDRGGSRPACLQD